MYKDTKLVGKIHKYKLMLKEIQKLEKKQKVNLVVSTVILTSILIILFNALILVVYIPELIKILDSESLSFSIKKGYFAINSHPVGISILVNSISFLSLWLVLIHDALRSIKELHLAFYPEKKYPNSII